MKYLRTIKFNYFQIKKIIGNDGTPKIFDFAEFLADLYSKEILMKTQEIEHSGLKYRIENILFNEENNLWYVRLMKMRDTNIPSKLKENIEAEPFHLEDDEYIGEDISFVYERESGIIMYQINRFSISPTKFQEILYSLNNNENEKFVLMPISFIFDQKAFRKDYYKKIDISFANLNCLDIDEKTPLGKIMRSFNKVGGFSAHVTIGLGHSKAETLNRDATQSIIDEARDNTLNIRGAKVTVKDDDDAKPEIIDLFDNVSCDYITFTLKSRETLDYDVLFRSMIDCFIKKKKELYELLSIE